MDRIGRSDLGDELTGFRRWLAASSSGDLGSSIVNGRLDLPGPLRMNRTGPMPAIHTGGWLR